MFDFMMSPASMNTYIKAQKRKAGKIHILKNSSVSNPSEKLPVLLIAYFEIDSVLNFNLNLCETASIFSNTLLISGLVL